MYGGGSGVDGIGFKIGIGWYGYGFLNVVVLLYIGGDIGFEVILFCFVVYFIGDNVFFFKWCESNVIDIVEVEIVWLVVGWNIFVN